MTALILTKREKRRRKKNLSGNTRQHLLPSVSETRNMNKVLFIGGNLREKYICIRRNQDTTTVCVIRLDNSVSPLEMIYIEDIRDRLIADATWSEAPSRHNQWNMRPCNLLRDTRDLHLTNIARALSASPETAT